MQKEVRNQLILSLASKGCSVIEQQKLLEQFVGEKLRYGPITDMALVMSSVYISDVTIHTF